MEELVKHGYITGAQLEKAKSYHQSKGCKLGQALVELGFVTAEKMESYSRNVIGLR